MSFVRTSSVLSIGLLSVLAACGSGDSSPTATAAPTFSPPAGTYATAQDVTISSATAGATIHYTTDGTTPSATSATYSAAIHVAATETIKAYATIAATGDSAVSSATYTINANAQPAATPTFSPGAGTYSSTQSVTISSATSGASIYYTVDGSTPTSTSTLYTAPVSVSASETIKAIATATGYTASAVASAAYVIGSGTDFASVCSQLFTKVDSLLSSCLMWNPALFTSAGLFSSNQCSVLAGEITAGRVIYNSSQASACLTTVNALTCASVSGNAGLGSCSALLTGTVANGGSCYVGADCAAGDCSTSHSSATCPGTCVAFATSGQACSTVSCASGLVCQGINPVCQTPSATGGACPCQSNLWCDSSGGSPGVCKVPLAAGATCSGSGPQGQCPTGYVCSGTPTPICKALVGQGGSCSADPNVCGGGYNCISGSCVSWPTTGQACNATTAPSCLGGYCNTSAANPVCVAYVADGGTCNPSLFGQDCASFSCNSTTNKCNPSYCHP